MNYPMRVEHGSQYPLVLATAKDVLALPLCPSATSNVKHVRCFWLDDAVWVNVYLILISASWHRFLLRHSLLHGIFVVSICRQRDRIAGKKWHIQKNILRLPPVGHALTYVYPQPSVLQPLLPLARLLVCLAGLETNTKVFSLDKPFTHVCIKGGAILRVGVSLKFGRVDQSKINTTLHHHK